MHQEFNKLKKVHNSFKKVAYKERNRERTGGRQEVKNNVTVFCLVQLFSFIERRDNSVQIDVKEREAEEGKERERQKPIEPGSQKSNWRNQTWKGEVKSRENKHVCHFCSGEGRVPVLHHCALIKIGYTAILPKLKGNVKGQSFEENGECLK